MMKTIHNITHANRQPPVRQRGFTIVEIMVAMTIGLLMMAGILQISMANKESSRLQRNMGYVQENIRSAMEFLTRDVRLAGHYIDDNPAASNPDAPAPFINVSPVTTAVTTAPVTADGGTNNSDQITLTRETNVDCLGQATPPDAFGNRFAINHYFISNQRLMCRGNTGGPQPLVEGVENLQILYGENTDGDPRSANRYVRADQVANMRDVVSVRIAMRFISREAVRKAADANQYALLDASAFIPLATDRLLRREITTTVLLRNDEVEQL